MSKTYVLFKFVRPFLALTIIGLSFGVVYLLILKEVPKENRESLNLILGFILGITSTVASYYFGTSKDKSDAEQIQNKTQTPEERKD